MAHKSLQARAVRVACRRGLAALAAVCVAQVARPAAGEPDEAGRVAVLQGQVKALSEALATARAENDALKARLDRREFEAAGGTVGDVVPGGRRTGEGEYRILDVNRELGVAVLSAGRRQGVRPGMTFAVMQGDRSVATVRVIDARADIAGAAIESASVWRQPRAQDRAIRVSGARD